MKKFSIFATLLSMILLSCQKEVITKSETLSLKNTTLKSIGNDSKYDASASQNHKPVTITAVYNFSTFPNVSGTFTTTGALNTSGTTTMAINPNANGTRAHCVIVLTSELGTITIHQECEFATSPAKGQWQIVDGTGAYANLKGNGSLLMPPNTEAMSGVIY